MSKGSRKVKKGPNILDRGRIKKGTKIPVKSLSPKLQQELRDIEKDMKEKKKTKERTWRDISILWYSVAPYVKSGYGVVTKHFVSRLINRGFTTMVVAYYGLQKGGFLKVGDIVTFPIDAQPGDNLGFRSVAQHHKKFNTDCVIFFTDFWVAKPLTKVVKETVAYTVLDHEDYAEEYQDVLRGFFKVAIASKHGCAEAKKYGVDARFIPHGVDTEVFYPLPKGACKKMLSVDPKTFVLGIVAANNDKEPRKGWDKMFQAIRIFMENNKEMRKPGKFKVFIHTDARCNRGYDLKLLAKRTGIGKYVIFQDPYMSIIGLPDKLMARIYSAFDVLINLARREGFCLPLLEAQACRVPGIATDFSAMTERLNYGKCGWLIKPTTTMLSPLGGVTAIPDEHKAAEALEEACFNLKKRELYAKRSLVYARQQTWDIAVDKYWLPFIRDIWADLRAPAQKKAAKVLFKNKQRKKKRKIKIRKR